MAPRGEEHRPGLDLADLEEGLACLGVPDVLLEAPDDMAAVALAPESAPAVEEAGVQKLNDGGEVGIVAIVRSGREEEAVGLAGQHLGQRCRAERSDALRR